MNWKDRVAHRIAPIWLVLIAFGLLAVVLLPGAIAVIADNQGRPAAITAGR